jgi:hypothetical protein
MAGNASIRTAPTSFLRSGRPLALPSHKFWKSIRKPAEARFERIAAEPVALLTARVGHLEDPLGLVDDKTARSIDLRLASEAVGVGDRPSQGPCTVVGDEMRHDRRKHA